MKIMILVPSFGRSSPIIGAFLFAKYLHEQGKDVVFISLDENYNSKECIIDEVISAGIDFECLNIEGWWGVYRHRSRIKNYCIKKNIDVVLAYLLRPTLLVSKLAQVVKVTFVRGMLRNDYTFSHGKIISNIFVALEMKALQKMDHVFAMTEAMMNWLVSEGTSFHRISVVNNFADVRLIKLSAIPDEPRSINNINIGMFCNLIPRKRLDVAFKAINTLIHDYKHHNLKLHLPGYGPQRSKLEEMVSELNIGNEVIFHGFVTNSLSLMQRMDLILLTSESEGTPRSLMEALSLGKTVVASDIPGVNELIRDKKTGYLFPVGDVEQLASTINHIIKKGAYLPSEQLVNFMLANYDVNVVCKSMLNQIERISGEIMVPSLNC